MANSKARAGRGAVLKIGGVTGSMSSSFTKVGEVSKASFSGSSWGTIDVTNFDSGVDDEFITSTRNNGDVNVEGNLVDDDAGQIAFQAAYDSGEKYDFTLQLLPGPGQTTGKLYAWSGLVTSLETAIETRSAVNFSSKIKVSGGITPTPGS